MTAVHVLVLTKQYRPEIKGGVGVVAATLADAYLSRGCQVTVIAEPLRCRRVSVSMRGRLQVIRVPGGSRSPLTRYRIPADVIHAHSYLVAPLAVRLEHRLGVPLVYTCHSFAMHEPPVARRRMLAQQLSLFRCAKCIVVPSRWAYRVIARSYPAFIDKTIVIPNGVAVPGEVPPAGRVSPARLLYVGRVVAGKGLNKLITAMGILKRQRPDVTLTVVGYDTGGQRRHLQRLADRVGVRNRIRWLGGRSHAATMALYRRYGAVVMPSRLEVFGLVALEALARGVPLVASRTGGLSDFVSGRVAAVIPAVTAPAIAASVSAMWRDPQRTAERVVAGHQVASRYSLGVSADRYLQLFAGLRSDGEPPTA